MDNTFIQEKLLPQLTFNPGSALTGFWTTRPWALVVQSLIKLTYDQDKNFDFSFVTFGEVFCL